MAVQKGSTRKDRIINSSYAANQIGLSYYKII